MLISALRTEALVNPVVPPGEQLLKAHVLPAEIARLQKGLLCMLLCCLLVAQPVLAYIAPSDNDPSSISPAVAEAAEILGLTTHVRSVLALSDELKRGAGGSVRRDLLMHKSLILTKILLGYLEVRKASDAIDVSLGYTYDAIEKESRKRDRLVDLCNIANFTQFGVQFSLAAMFRLRALGFPSAVLTNTTGGLTLGVSSLALLLGRSGKSRDRCPPNVLADFFELGPPAESQLPDKVKKFVNSVAPGASRTRKDETIDRWRTRYHLDASRKEKLGHLAAFPQRQHGESIGLLNNRLVLLYALNALVEDFDQELLTLLRFLESSAPVPADNHINESANYIAELSPGAVEAAKLLEIQPQVAALIEFRHKYGSQISSDQQLRLEILLLEKVLGGALEVRQAVDRIDQEKHYQFDVVLSQLNSSRDQALRLNNVANFTQTGILKTIAGGLFFNDEFKAGGDLLMVISGLNIGLASLALKQARGGKRKLDEDTNVLAHFLNLDPPIQYRFSPLIWKYLNSPPPNSKSQTSRREELIARWKQHGTLSKIDNPKRMSRLAAMPSLRDKKVDTINLVWNRLWMLFDVKAMVEGLDSELLELVRAAD